MKKIRAFVQAPFLWGPWFGRTCLNLPMTVMMTASMSHKKKLSHTVQRSQC